MKWHLLLAAVGTAEAAAVYEPFGQPQYLDGTWCYTYLSTYLTPVQAKTASPDLPTPSSVPATSARITPTKTTSLRASTTESAAEVSESGEAVIFLVTPRINDDKRDLVKRDTGGFVGANGDNVDICTFASSFRLVSGELLDNGSPIYYSRGDSFKELTSEGAPPNDAITTGFIESDGTLLFVNSALPNDQAGFCQDPDSGRVFITFDTAPEGCEPVLLRVFAGKSLLCSMDMRY